MSTGPSRRRAGHVPRVLLAAAALAVLGAACGASSGNTLGANNPAAAPTGCLQVGLPQSGGSVPFTLPVGTALCLATGGVSGVLQVTNHTPAVLAGSGGGPYRGQRVGSDTLTVSQSPRCSPGQACPHVVVLLGRVIVTVAAR